MSLALNKLKKRPPEDLTAKPKRKIDRFDGLTEEEVQKYTLEDILEPDLDLVVVGINPSLTAAHRGRYYAGPGNHFYKLLHASELVPRFVSFEEDRKLLNYKIGLTNIVARATRSSADLKKSEIKEGSEIVREKLKIFKPKIAVFNGKCIFEVFAEKTGKSDFNFGLQTEKVGETAIWVVPSSSARCAHFPRMHDKLHFYSSLKKYLSFLKGEIPQVDLAEFRFDGKCKQKTATTSKMWRRKNVSAFLFGGRVANKAALDVSEENIGALRGTEFVVTEILSGNDENRELDENAATAVKSNFDGEVILASETKSDSLAAPSTGPRYKNLKRSRSQPVGKKLTAPPSCFRSVSQNDSTDFMDLIKKRLSEKKNVSESEEQKLPNTLTEAPETKKLKYANLRLSGAKKRLDADKEAEENSPEA